MLNYYLFRTGYFLAKFLPTRVAYWLCSVAGGLVFYLVPSIRRGVMSNLRHVMPRASEHRRRHVARRVVRNQYKNYYDLLRIPHLHPDDVLKMMESIEGQQYMEAARDAGRGFLIVSAHVGNFSIVAQLACVWGYKVALVAEDIKPPKLYNFMTEMRGWFGIHLIKTGSTQVRTIYRFLRDGGALMLAADRNVTHTDRLVRFFDAPAALPEGPVTLAMRLNLPLIMAFTWRLPNNKNKVIILPPVELDRTGDFDRDLVPNMYKVVKLMEEMISRAPDQWVALQPVWGRDYTEQQAAGAENKTEPAGLQPAAAPEASTDGHDRNGGPAAAPLIAAGQLPALDPKLSPATEREKAES